MKKLLSYMKTSLTESILAPLFKLLEALFELFVPLVVADMIDAGSGGTAGARSYILTRGALLLGLGVIGLVSSVTAQYFAAKAAAETGREMRGELFTHILSLPRAEIDRQGTSTLINRVSGDVDQVQTGVNMFLRLFMRSPFVVFGALIMAFTVDRRAAAVFAAVILLLIVIVALVTKISMPLFRRSQDSSDRVLRSVRENLLGVRVVRAFGQEDNEKRNFNSFTKELFNRQRRSGRVSSLLNPLTFAVINLGTAAVILVGGYRVNAGILTTGAVVALVNYMSQILVELLKIANLMVTLSRAGASMTRVNAVFALESEDGGKGESGETDPSAPAVEFRDVFFSYAGASRAALEGISFSVGRGETVGIIGGTGSGKSTLIGLIPRFFDADSGQVLVLGREVGAWRREELLKSVAVVPQKTELFSGTLRDNLLWGNSRADDASLFDALDAAQACDFVKEKGKGLSLEVEQNGKNFSGGQRQRISVARALARRAPIIILDDSSSALDYATDAAMRKAIAGYCSGSAVIIVSQRVSGVRGADRILLVDDGRIAAQGTHEQLLEGSELYREICASQSAFETEAV